MEWQLEVLLSFIGCSLFLIGIDHSREESKHHYVGYDWEVGVLCQVDNLRRDSLLVQVLKYACTRCGMGRTCSGCQSNGKGRWSSSTCISSQSVPFHVWHSQCFRRPIITLGSPGRKGLQALYYAVRHCSSLAHSRSILQSRAFCKSGTSRRSSDA